MPTANIRRLILIGLATAAAYVLTARLGFRVAFAAEQITTVWAPTGIAVATLILWGRSLWPAIWLAAFVVNLGTDAPLWTAAGIACGNTLEAVASATALRRLRSFDPALTRVSDAVAFILAAVLLSTALSATTGVAILSVAGVQPWNRFLELWFAWWLGDALGALVVAPAVLTVARSRVLWSRRAVAETCLFVIGGAVLTEVVFAELFNDLVGQHPLEYLIFCFVIVAAVRGRQPTTALVVLAVSAVTIWNTVHGTGPFASAPVHHSLILLQVFMGVIAGTGLLMAAAIEERTTSERRRAAAYGVGEVLATASDLKQAAPAILQSLCDHLHCQVGALWVVDPTTQRLRSLATWPVAGSRTRAFVVSTESMLFSANVGLPGRVWSSGEAAWIEDVVHDTNFPRAAAARSAGVHGAFAFPIRLQDDVLGVIECFTYAVAAPDPDLLRTMTTVGNQVGMFIARKRGETASVQAEHEREALLLRESAARREAETASRAKDDFLATLSHELRTPLNAIVGWTRMLLDGSLEDERTRQHALHVIDRNAHLQVQLVSDILDVSRIITGGLKLDLQPVDLESVIGTALDSVRPAADAKKIRLRSRLAASARLVHGDPQRLQQIVWNLLTNAVKFGRTGGTVDVDLFDAGRAGVRVRISDDGTGIHPDFLPHVFERFRQADGSVSRQHGGLGLGLAIVRHLTELHGGTVRAESPGLGKGATVTVEFPRLDSDMPVTASSDVQGSAPIQQSPWSSGSLVGCCALVVDDEQDSRELIEMILTRAGATVETASSAYEALVRLDTRWPDVLLTDIGMPGMDGYELIQEVRNREAQGRPRLPAAAITAYAGDHDRERVLTAGFDRHIAKPVDPSSMVETVVSMRQAQSHP